MRSNILNEDDVKSHTRQIRSNLSRPINGIESKDQNQSCLKSLRTNNSTMKSVVLLLLPACLLPALAKAQNLAKYGIIDQQAPLGTYGFNNNNNNNNNGNNGFGSGSNNGNNGLGGGLNGNNNNGNNGNNGFVGGLNGNVGIGGVSGPSVEEVNLKMLRGSVPGTPGVDYPIFSQAPITNFDCSDKIFGGYYADVDAQCQSFHICGRDGGQGWSFICPNGTIFNQAYLICDWWFNFDCTQAQAFYNVNLQLGVIPFGSTTTFINDNGIGSTNNNNNGFGNNNNNGFGNNNNNNNNNNGFGNNNNNNRPINSYGSPIRTTVSTFTNNAQPTIINRNLPNSNSFNNNNNNNGFLSSNNPSLTTYTNNNGRSNQGNTLKNNNNNNGINIVDDTGDYVYSTDDVIYDDDLTNFNGNNVNGGGSGVQTTTTIIEPVGQNYGVPLGNPIGGNSLRQGRAQKRRNRNRS